MPSQNNTPRSNASPSNPSPMISPMHDPHRSAVVVNKKLPLGLSKSNQVIPGQNVDSSIPGAALGQKALLAKKFAKPNTISPTDQIQSPCTKKLAGAKQRHFSKGKGASLGQRFAAVDENNKPETAGAKS